MLNKLRCHIHFSFSAHQITWSSMLIQIHIINDKQYSSRSVDLFRSQFIWIHTICKGRTYLSSAGPGLIDDYDLPAYRKVFPSLLTLLLRNTTCPVLANSVDPDSEANWSGSALFVIKHMNLSQQPGSSNLIGRKLEVGMASIYIQHDKG